MALTPRTGQGQNPGMSIPPREHRRRGGVVTVVRRGSLTLMSGCGLLKPGAGRPSDQVQDALKSDAWQGPSRVLPKRSYALIYD